MPRLSRKPSVSIVGAGRAGTALARLFASRGFRVVSVISRTSASALRLARLVGCRVASTDVRDLSPDTRLLVLATPDRSLSSVAMTVARRAPLTFSRLIAFHPSGSMTSSVLAPLRRKGSVTFALHPIASFSRGWRTDSRRQGARRIPFGFEGPPRARRSARALVRALGGTWLEIPKKKKIPYHIACVFASNYVCLLLAAAEEMVRVEPVASFRKALYRLAEGTLSEAAHRTAVRALTGPVLRNDLETVRAHLEYLNRMDPRLADLYRTLGAAVLRTGAGVRGRAGRHLRTLLDAR